MNELDAKYYKRVKDKFLKYKTTDKYINAIIDVVTDSAAESELNAACDGAPNDGGSSRIQAALSYWLDGINFVKTGNSEVYGNIIKEFSNKEDKDYTKYLELKAKFEGKSMKGIGITKI